MNCKTITAEIAEIPERKNIMFGLYQVMKVRDLAHCLCTESLCQYTERTFVPQRGSALGPVDLHRHLSSRCNAYALCLLKRLNHLMHTIAVSTSKYLTAMCDRMFDNGIQSTSSAVVKILDRFRDNEVLESHLRVRLATNRSDATENDLTI